MKVSIQYDHYLPRIQKELGLEVTDCDGYVAAYMTIDRTKREGFRLRIQEQYKYKDGSWEEMSNRIFVDPPPVEQVNEVLAKMHTFQAEEAILLMFKKMGITPEQAREHGSYFRLSLLADGEINYVPTVRLRRMFPLGNFMNGDYQYDYKDRKVNFPSMNQSIGRFLRKILPDVPDTKIEELVDIAKAHQLEYKVNLYEVSDERILWAYLADNYDHSFDLGPLRNSCMRGEDMQERLKFFVEEPKASLLVASRNVGGVEKVVGRVIIWTLDDGTRAMEYEYAGGAVRNLFNEYADKNNIKHTGWLENQNVGITLTAQPRIYYPSLDSLRVTQRGQNTVLIGYCA